MVVGSGGTRAVRRALSACAVTAFACAPCSAAPPADRAAAAGAPRAAAASPARLSVEDAVRIGATRNPQVTAALAGAEAAHAAYRSLSAFPGPTLGVTHARGSSSAPTLTGGTNDTFVDIGETLDTSGQRRNQAAAAHAQWGVAQYTLQETSLSIEQQVRDAYWSLAAARAQTAAAREALQEVQQVHRLTLLQEQAGESPHVDVVRAGIDEANAQQAFVTAQGTEQAALAALNVLLSRPPYQPVELADTLTTTGPAPEPIPTMPSLEELQRMATANRPLLRQAHQSVLAARYSVRQAKSTRLPDLSIDYQRSVQQTAGGEAIVLSARFPLLDFGAIGQSIHAAAQTETQARALEVAAMQQVAAEVATARTNYTQAQALAASYQAQILQPSVQLLQMAQTGYEHGGTGILPVIDAEATLRNARIGYINALLALFKARNEVYAATGGLTSAQSKS